jgi:transcription termination factor Rho
VQTEAAAVDVEAKPKSRVRKSTAKEKAAQPAAPAEEFPTVKDVDEAAPGKAKSRSTRKKRGDTTGELPLNVPPARRLSKSEQQKAAAKLEQQKTAAHVIADGATEEEWSPSRSSGTRKTKPKAEICPPAETASSAAARPRPAAAVSATETPLASTPTEAPQAQIAPATEPAPIVAPVVSSDGTPIAAPPPPGRKYPVYIPRHIAKQMEAEGQTDPAAIAAAAAAAVAAQSQARAERAERHERGDRGERPDGGAREHHHARTPEPRPEREQAPPREEEIGSGEGIVEISGKGFGFIRDTKRGFAQHPADIFVTPELVKRYNLRDGQWIKGETRKGGRGSQLFRITEINGEDPEKARTLPAFDELTVINPMERFRLETVPERYTTRVVDLMTPIGKGQRGLIVAPPRTGKTTLLQHIADAVVKNHPEVKLIMLLVDERPEEVTEIKRTVPSAEIMASSNDMDVKSHTRIAQLAIERAKRLAESGKDVFVLLDSITRVGRAFNNAMAGGGRTMSGGVDARALEIPRRLFAAARNTEEAGSITIIATALIETGSRMDDLIFQEFKGTGNMELVLDRKIADQRIYPAVDIFQSGTRREELLVPADDLHKIAIIRRGLAGHKPIEAIERLLFFAKKFPTNAQMLREIPG